MKTSKFYGVAVKTIKGIVPDTDRYFDSKKSAIQFAKMRASRNTNKKVCSIILFDANTDEVLRVY